MVSPVEGHDRPGDDEADEAEERGSVEAGSGLLTEVHEHGRPGEVLGGTVLVFGVVLEGRPQRLSQIRATTASVAPDDQINHLGKVDAKPGLMGSWVKCSWM